MSVYDESGINNANGTINGTNYTFIGKRLGERLHELLITDEEKLIVTQISNAFTNIEVEC